MTIPWRLKWLIKELRPHPTRFGHRAAFKQPWKYWLALFLKAPPLIAYPFSIELKLKSGGSVIVNDFMALYICNEIFVEGCYDIALDQENPVIIDVGANIGMFVIRMKQLYPQAKIFAYEPMPGNYHQLRANLGRNGLDNVVMVQKGVGGTPRMETLYIHPKNIGGHSIHATLAGGRKSLQIELMDVELILGALDGATCSLLKLDCEGAEFEIIKSLTPETAAKIEKIVFESTRSLYNVKELVRHLESLEYRVSWQHGLYLAVRQQ